MEAFAAEQELPAQRLRYWQKRLATRGSRTAESATQVLLPVRVAQPVQAPLELVVGDRCVVRVSHGFDEATLLRVLTLLGNS